MRARIALSCVLALLAAVLAAPMALRAQEYVDGQDFLTEHEVDVVREAQDPLDRVTAYLGFAALRLELIKQKLAVEEAGRSVTIHRNLDEYSQIIDAVDTVMDDAISRDVDVTKPLELLSQQEETFLATLTEFKEKPKDDHWRYEFVLEDAIDITTDSMDLNKEAVGDRKQKITDADEADQKKVTDSMMPEMRKEAEKAKKAARTKEAEEKRKRPTLMKPGETEDKGKQE